MDQYKFNLLMKRKERLQEALATVRDISALKDLGTVQLQIALKEDIEAIDLELQGVTVTA